MKKCFYIIFLYILCSLNLSAYSKTLTNENNSYDFLNDVEYFEDSTNSLEITDILKKNTEFNINESNSLNFGFSKSSYWFKFDIENKSSQNEWILEVGFPKLYEVTVFIPTKEKNFFIKRIGNKYSTLDREIKTRKIVFELPIDNFSKKQTIYLKVFSPNTAIQVPIKVMTKKTFWEKSLVEEAFYTFFFGIFFVMIIYNFMIFIIFKEKVYLFYSLFNFSLLMIQVSLNNYGYYFLWGNSRFDLISMMFFGNLLALSFVIFLSGFLELKKSDKIYHILRLITYFDIFNMLIILSIGVLPKYNSFSFILQSFTIIGIMINYSRNKLEKHIKILFFSWIIVSLSAFIFILNKLGFLNKNFFTDNILLMTSALSSIVISIALAEKFKIYRYQKDKYFDELETANEELLIYKNHLELLVKEKTSEL